MYHISFQQMNYFIKVAEILNFTKASKLLYISQPALSKQIAVLEKELDFPLFIRCKHNVKLTPEGESIYNDWKAIINSMQTSINNAKILRHQLLNRLNIGWTDGFNFDEPLLKLMEKFKIKFPKIKTNLESHSLKRLKNNLEADLLDIIFIPQFELESYKNVSWTHFQDVNFAIAVPMSNPLSKKENLTISELINEPFIVLSSEESSNSVKRIKATCRQNGFEPNIVKYVANINSLMLSIKNGEGVSICNNKISDKNIKIYDVETEINDMDLIAIWKNENQSSILSSFISVLSEFQI